MKKANRILALILILSLVFSLFACKGNSKEEETTIPPETEASSDALEKFTDAAKELSERTSLFQDISIETKRSVGNHSYKEKTKRTADFIDLGSEAMMVSVSEKRTLDELEFTVRETYSAGKVYSEYGENGDAVFSAEIPAEDYLFRCLPPVIIDPELYGSVEYAKDDKSTVIFSDPDGLEDWLAPEYAKMISAKGKVKLSGDNTVESMSYTVEYRQGPALISSEYTVKVGESTVKAEDISIPADEGCVSVPDIDAPLYVFYAQNGISGSPTVMGSSSCEIVIPEGGIVYSEDIGIDLYNNEGVFVSKLEQSITVHDSTGSQDYEVCETYKDGKATSTVNGEETESALKPSDFKNFAKNELSAFLFAPSYFSEINVTHADEFVLIDYTIPADSGVGEYYEDQVCQTLYNDSDYLDGHSEKYTTHSVCGYLAVDKDSLLPTSVGFNYLGSHVIGGETLQLIYNATQAVTLSSDEAYTNVTDKYVPEKEPENKATPLLYEVTSPEGAKMYMLGTIHVADERAAYLPDELYAALDEADVLAVEIDPYSFEEKLLADEALIELAQKSYYYLDGTGIKDHVSEEVYEYGVAAMKIAGQYSAYSDMMRPSLWSSTLDYFLMDTSMELYSYKGIDERLLKIAKDAGKEIRDIETVEGRLSMEISYPEKAHELMLESSLAFNRADTLESVREMYDLWCEGDEKKLIEYMRKEDELSPDATEEEIKAYEEYNRIMVTDRDAIMLEAAKSYLENPDEVVFYAVGMAHILGKTGLLDGLRDAGYTVTPVEYE